jgi:hypothetical protein
MVAATGGGGGYVPETGLSFITTSHFHHRWL